MFMILLRNTKYLCINIDHKRRLKVLGGGLGNPKIIHWPQKCENPVLKLTISLKNL